MEYTPIDYKKVGNKIRDLREKEAMLQSDLAKKIGVDQSYISYVESGIKKPTLDVLSIISAVFDITLNDLVYS